MVALNGKIPAGVEVATRQKAGKQIIFVMNYTGTVQTVPLEQAYKNALTGKTEPMDVEIPAYDVKVLTEE
jgi:beta-galactosidase GanA